jgi:Dockerin type I domain/Bacterial Ig domain
MPRPNAMSWWRKKASARLGRSQAKKPRDYARPLAFEQFEVRTLLATVTLTASADNTMFEESGDLSNGAGIFFFVGRTQGSNGALTRRGLVRFNFAGAGGVPSGAQVTSATLQMRVTRAPPGNPSQAISVHKATANWGEGTSDATCLNGQEGCGVQATTNDATWTQRLYPSTPWGSPGGDFDGTPSATTAVAGVATYQWTSPQLVADVQGWVNAAATNFGWVVKEDNEAATRTAKQFASRQNANAANRPQLIIEYAGANLPPTLNTIPNPAAILEDAALQTVNLAGISAGAGEVQDITITAVSSNPSLIPNPTVNYASPNATGSLTYTPADDQNGSAVITVTVMDDGGTDGTGVDTLVRSFTVNVTAVNDAPEINAIANLPSVPENGGVQAVSLTGLTAGPSNESQTLTVTATSSNTTLIPNPTIAYTNPNTTGTLSFTPATNQSGTATITVRVQDSGGTANGGVNATTRTFSVTVVPVNDPPTLNTIANPAAILEDTTAAQTVNLAGIGAGPGETQTLTVTATSSNTALIPNPTVNYTSPNATGSLSYTPVANQFGSATITVTVRDNGGTTPGVDTVTRTFTVNVTGVNDAPTLAAIADPPAIARNATAQTVNLAGITAGPTNETQTLTITATSSNPGLIPNPSVTYTSPAATGSLSYTPVANQVGTAVITVRVTDDGGTTNGGINSVTRTFTVNVVSINEAPTLGAIANPAAILEDAAAQTVSLTGISAGPGETQTLTVTAVSSNLGLIPNPAVTYTSPGATGTLSYTPIANRSGTAVITVTVTDSGGTAAGGVDTVTRTFTVNVTPVNDAPTLTAISSPVFILLNAGLQTIPLAGISAGPGETQSLTITAASSNTGLIPNPTVVYTSPAPTGSLTFTPVADLSGSAVITVTVTDTGGTASGGVNSLTRTFTVNVSSSVNDPPSFTKGLDQTAVDGSGPKSVSGWATAITPGPPDEASQAVDFLVVNDNTALFLVQPVVDPTGTLTFTPQPNVRGVAQVTIRLHDNGGTDLGGVDTSDPQTFVITITKPHVWHNTKKGLDVTGDNNVVAGDALAIINYINAFGSGPVPPGAALGPNFLDVTDDDNVAPNDALAVINAINAGLSGEGEAATPETLSEDRVFAELGQQAVQPSHKRTDILAVLLSAAAESPRRLKRR